MRTLIEQKTKLRVLVAERSSFSRLVLEDILGAEQDISVCGLAADGEQLLQQLQSHKVDVVLASASIRHNKHLFAFKRIFSESPTPILMLVEREQLTLELLKEAIELGVYSVIVKPNPNTRPDYRAIAGEIRAKVKAVRESEYWNPDKRLRMLEEVISQIQPVGIKPHNLTADTIIVLGASTGGIQALEAIVKQLHPDLKASVLIALHLPAKFTQSFAKRLMEVTPLRVTEGRTGLIPQEGKIIVAPGGRNMIVQSVMGNAANLKIGFADDSSAGYDMPSADLLMQSVANSSVNRVIGVVLTGMGKDGTAGTASIFHRAGGHTIAQNEETSAIFGMAKSAIESGNINKVLPLSQIAFYLNRYVAEQQQVSTSDRDT